MVDTKHKQLDGGYKS